MSRNRSSRRVEAFEDIARLKASRRLDIIKCTGALAAIVLLVGGKAYLEMSGIIEPGNIVVGAVMMFSAIGLAVLGGSASLDFTRSKGQILDIRSRNGISKQDLADYEAASK